MKRYESYKDSGVKWLGEIPGHWEVIRLKALLIERIEKNNNKENLIILSLLKDKGIIPYDEKGAIGNNSKEDLSQYKIARKGDLVINSMNVIIGSVGITQYDGYISPAYYSFKPRGIINLIYYYYLMTLRSVQQSIRCYSKGIMEIRLRITSNDFLSMPFPFPPKSEQTAIANYLNSVTSKIDEAISQQQKMIDLLNERKQIIIQNAVTKGLDPNAKMKDSGVEWIGEIPENWRLNRFKNLFKTRSGITFTKKQIVEYGESVISYGQIHSKDNYGSRVNPELIRFIPKKLTKNKGKAKVVEGDFLFADTSEDFEGCGNNVYIDCKTPIYAGYHTILAKKNNNEVGQYLAYLFASRNWRGQVRSLVNGVKVYSITQTILKSVYVVLPPIEEQLSIAEYLNVKVGNIDKKIKSIENYISLLQERKQIIINDVVTGKVKVI